LSVDCKLKPKEWNTNTNKQSNKAKRMVSHKTSFEVKAIKTKSWILELWAGC